MRLRRKLNHMGVSSKDLRYFHRAIERYNIAMLRNFSALTVPLVVFVMIISLFSEQRGNGLVAYCMFIAFSIAFAIGAANIIKNNSATRTLVYCLLTLYSFVIYAETIYLDVFANKEDAGTMFLIFLIASQVIYVMPVSWNLITSIVPTLTYCISSLLVKNPEICIQDIRNAVFALLMGICLNYINSREKLQLIINNGKLTKDFAVLAEATETDPLTGLYNKIVSQNKLEELAIICSDEKCSIFAAIIDVDFFKKYNDTYGHKSGDEVLKSVSGVMKKIAKEYNLIAGRVGGEEFMFCGVVGSRLQANRICDRFCSEIRALHIEHKSSETAPYITVSVGVCFNEIGSDDDAGEIYEHADEALYDAKRAGRNRVQLYYNKSFVGQIVKK